MRFVIIARIDWDIFAACKKVHFYERMVDMNLAMGIMGPVILLFCIIGTMRYNKLRENWAHVTGVFGSYVIFLGLLSLIGLIGIVISLILGKETDTSEVIPLIITTLVCLGYLVVCMMRCKSTKERIMLPFVVSMIAAGFCWRLLGSIIFRTPMSSGTTNEFDLSQMPNIIYDDGNNRWQLQHRNRDTVVYHNDEGREVMIYSGQISGTSAQTSEGHFHWY